MADNEKTDIEKLQDGLDYLSQTKDLIKQAIVSKGQTIGNDTPFREYASKIADIETGEDISEYIDNILNKDTDNNMTTVTQVIKKLPRIIIADNVTSLHDAFYNSLLEVMPEMNTENITNMTGMFASSKIKEFPNFDTSNVVNMQAMFSGNREIIIAPQMNTKNVTNMSYMFQNCKNLVDVPIYDTTNVTTMLNMFAYCNKLTDESLDNILVMCINATSYTGTKKLNTIGITNVNTRVPNLPHYQDFLDAGWTI